MCFKCIKNPGLLTHLNRTVAHDEKIKPTLKCYHPKTFLTMQITVKIYVRNCQGIQNSTKHFFHCNSSANPAQSPRQAQLFFFLAFWTSRLCSHSGFGWSGLFIPHQTIFNQQWSFTHSFQLLWGYWFLRYDIHHVWSCSWKDWKNHTVKDTNECPLCTSWKIKYEQAGSKGGNKIGLKSPLLL